MDTCSFREYLTLDMSSLRFQWDESRTALAVLTSRGEVIALHTADPTADPREEAFAALDAALDRGRILRTRTGPGGGRVRYRIALYNPYTGEVSVARVPDTVALTDGERLELPEHGTAAVLERSPGQVLLRIDGRVLSERTASFASLTRAMASHGH